MKLKDHLEQNNQRPLVSEMLPVLSERQPVLNQVWHGDDVGYIYVRCAAMH